MRPAPSLSDLPKYPIVGGVALLALGVSIASFAGRVDVSPLMENALVRRGEIWRFVTSILPHGSPMHLIFNLYWLWALGTVLEMTYGHARTLAIILVLALGSGAAQYALDDGGIGLSGVGYGMWGMLYVLSRRDPRFAGAVDYNTNVVFVAWFFLCIIGTVAGAMNAGNVAHGAGAAIGALLGLTASGRERLAYGAAVTAVVAGSVVGAVFFRPVVNLMGSGHDEAVLGYKSLEAGRDEEAAALYEDAVKIDGKDANSWYKLGVAYDRLGRRQEAERSYRRAHELNPGERVYREAVKDFDPPPGEVETYGT